MGLGGRLDEPAGRLSYGEQRQLEIGVALATRPRLLLLDEPTAGMSPEETLRMTALLQALPRETTLLVIEHDMDVVFSLAERITVLHHGEVLCEGTPAPLVLAMVEGHRFTSAEIEQFRQLLDRLEGKEGKGGRKA